MFIDFKKVSFKNFLSYSDASIDLNDKGCCLIRGENKFKKDSALSNGSGKSTIINAICWALTGETVNRNSNNVKNIYIDDKECWVKLNFCCDGNEYELTRFNQPKSDLKIIINGEDKSGKGIRESEIQLANLIPDLSSDLITNVILLGQGLPNRFSSHSPSGRKELLEKLSKSDFMIQDIKDRISKREQELNNETRKIEDKQIELKTSLNLTENLLKNVINNLDELRSVDYDKELEECLINIKNNKEKIENILKQINDINENREIIDRDLNNYNNFLIQLKNDINLKYSEELGRLKEKRAGLIPQLQYLNSEVKKLKSIVDICPTCGQKIPNKVKPDTSSQEEQLKILNEELDTLNKRISDIDNSLKKELEDINIEYSFKIKDLKDQQCRLNESYKKINSELNSENKIKDDLGMAFNQLTVKKQSLEVELKKLQNQLSKYKIIVGENKEDLEKLSNIHSNLDERLSIIKKMNTLVKRDFRGYLLFDIIAFIDKKVKEYSEDIFGSNNIDIQLNGNDIDITFNGKPCESLSGGERQKVDLITQLAIRDMLSTYLNFHSSILCLDEIADNLDVIGSTKIFQLIANKLPDVDSIFIISHHEDSLSIPIDTEIRVIKDTNGISHVEY